MGAVAVLFVFVGLTTAVVLLRCVRRAVRSRVPERGACSATVTASVYQSLSFFIPSFLSAFPLWQGIIAYEAGGSFLILKRAIVGTSGFKVHCCDI